MKVAKSYFFITFFFIFFSIFQKMDNKTQDTNCTTYQKLNKETIITPPNKVLLWRRKKNETLFNGRS